MTGGVSPPSLLLLFGPPAVGKTTAGQELERLTGFRLFHIHQVIDLVTQYFPYSTSLDSSYYRLLVSYRRQFFEEAAGSGLQVIATPGWWLETLAQVETIQGYIRPVLERGGRVWFVELVASLEARIVRNTTENRRRLKRVDWSTEEYLRRDAAIHRYDSDGAIPFDLPFLRIETDELGSEATAQRICARFGLPRLAVDH